MKVDTTLYKQQFNNTKSLIGKKIQRVTFYLDEKDIDFTEQPNNHGKSLLNGIDIETENEIYSIGNRFVDNTLGLSIDIGQTNNLELESDIEIKVPRNYPTKIIGQKILQANIYWLTIPILDMGSYPQEIEIVTENGYFLLASVEVFEGQLIENFSNELLVVEDLEKAKLLKLGQFGIGKYFENYDLLMRANENGI